MPNIKPPAFKIQQVALFPYNDERAVELLQDLGLAEWTNDIVEAEGQVFGVDGSNVAHLRFNYQAGSGSEQVDHDLAKPLELEILKYTDGVNWMEQNHSDINTVSHLGMHCTAEELVQYREYFASKHIDVAQEVVTQSHTNAYIADSRRYNYVIFDTREIIGVDLKFIVRLGIDGKPL